MKNKSLLANLVLFGALAVAVPVFAKPMSANLPLTHNVKVGQTELKAGDYRFLIDGNHMTILLGKKQVAEADGRWEDRDSKAPYNSIVSNAEGKLIELRFEGKKNVFVLPQ
jgi:plastocyanin domain-containing protein